MVKSLDRKLFRDLWSLKGQILTIALVIASGIATLVSSWSTYNSLQFTQQAFYNQSRFSEVFADLKKAPPEIANTLQAIPGVRQLETRIVTDALLDLDRLAEPGVGRFISLPDHHPQQMNTLHLKEGRLPVPNSPSEVAVSLGFAKAHQLRLGDRVRAIFNGRYREVEIVGIALSPEFVFALRGALPLPDDLHYGIFWMSETVLGGLVGMGRSFNSVTATYSPGTNVKGLLQSIDGVLRPYGGLGSYERKDQLSHLFLTDELRQLKTQAIVMPLIFLGVAAFLLNVILSRLISTQRTQVATLRACGYSHGQIFFHYFKMVLVIVLLGSILGVWSGYHYGQWMTSLYTDFYRFPSLNFFLQPNVVGSAIFCAAFAGLFGTYQSLWSIIRLQPAEALKPPSPPVFHGGISDWVTRVRTLGPRHKMVIRNLFFRPVRLLVVLIGVGLAMAIVILGMFWTDAVDFIFRVQFELAQREDAQVVFSRPLGRDSLFRLRSFHGVLQAEGLRFVPVKMVADQRSYQLALTGIPRGAQMRVLLNKELKPLDLPPDGVLLTRQIANRLQLKAGDQAWFEVLEGEKPKLLLPIAGVVDDWVGYGAYIDIDSLWRILGEAPSYSVANIKIDPKFANQVFATLKEAPRVAAVNSKEWTLRTFRQTTAKFVLVFGGILTFFSMLITIGIVYNSARVLLAERSWELASLRVLGFHRKEVFSLLFTELMIQILLSIPFGIGLGYYLGHLSTRLIHTDTFQFPFIFAPATVAMATLLVTVTGLISALIVGQRVRQLDVVTALKARD